MTPERERACRFYADMINAYRLVPRIILIVYYSFFIYAWFTVVRWFFVFDWNSLPKDPVIGSVAAAAVAGFPAIILGILTKVLAQLTESYWGGKSVKHVPVDHG